jgi:hypothetical protein
MNLIPITAVPSLKGCSQEAQIHCVHKWIKRRRLRLQCSQLLTGIGVNESMTVNSVPMNWLLHGVENRDEPQVAG